MGTSILPQKSSGLENMPTLVITLSTELLEKTAAACQHALASPTPPLDKDRHIRFLRNLGLMPKLPRGFVSLDASRPWIMYWVLCALKLLGADISAHRQRYHFASLVTDLRQGNLEFEGLSTS